MGSFNFYEDPNYADAYSKLEFHGTYYLAYRDLPQIFEKHVRARKAVDFGCGAGRSTRFLRRLGFDVVGIDISEEMLQRARQVDPEGDYRLIDDGDFSRLQPGSCDLILSAFTFDNIPAIEQKSTILKGLSGLLNASGKFVNLVSAPEIYVHEWASFSTKDFPQNRVARSGDEVLIVNTAIADSRPVKDILMTGEAYAQLFADAALRIVDVFRPLGRTNEPFEWLNETTISPWAIYVLEKQADLI